MKWTATFDIWPYHGSRIENGEVKYEFVADRIDQALEKANLIKMGIETNEKVWQCIVRELIGKHS